VWQFLLDTGGGVVRRMRSTALLRRWVGVVTMALCMMMGGGFELVFMPDSVCRAREFP
jgi:hypothetical protein